MQRSQSERSSIDDPSADRRAWASALRILSRRDHTCRELAVKLGQRGFNGASVDTVLQRCLDLGYLDDARTAAVMAGHLIARGYGPRRIRQVLGQKGLDDTLIDHTLADCSDEEILAEQARRMLAKRRASLNREADARKRRQKAYRYLMGRGFSADIIHTIIDDA